MLQHVMNPLADNEWYLDQCDETGHDYLACIEDDETHWASNFFDQKIYQDVGIRG